MFGASIAASRAGVARLGEQQPAVLLEHPAHRPRDVVARVLPVMCGTLKRSRTIVTPARGTRLRRAPGPSGPTPKPSDLKFVSRSASVTWSNSGVSASYISACCVGAGGRRHRPVLAGGDDVARGGGVVVGGRPVARRRRTPPRQARRSWTWRGTLYGLTCCAAARQSLPCVAPPAHVRRRDVDYAAYAQRPGPSRSPCAPRHRLRGVDVDRAFPSASVLKAMLLVAYLRHVARAAAARQPSARC